jgi:hypothetical protein
VLHAIYAFSTRTDYINEIVLIQRPSNIGANVALLLTTIFMIDTILTAFFRISSRGIWNILNVFEIF